MSLAYQCHRGQPFLLKPRVLYTGQRDVTVYTYNNINIHVLIIYNIHVTAAVPHYCIYMGCGTEPAGVQLYPTTTLILGDCFRAIHFCIFAVSPLRLSCKEHWIWLLNQLGLHTVNKCCYVLSPIDMHTLSHTQTNAYIGKN